MQNVESGIPIAWIQQMWIPQTRIFYGDLLPVVYACAVALGAKPAIVADIGSGSGAGAALISDATNGILGWGCQLHGFDIQSQFASYAAHYFPQIKYEASDVFDSIHSFDVAILSHTLEHIEEPEAFVTRLVQKAALSVIYVPFEEESLIPGHVVRFDATRIEGMPGFIWGRVSRSMGWTVGPSAKVAMFVCARPDVPQSSRDALKERLGNFYESCLLQSSD